MPSTGSVRPALPGKGNLVRWDELFRDLEGQVAAVEAADLAAEVADRTRRESALLTLADRARGSVGARVTAQERVVAAQERRAAEGEPAFPVFPMPQPFAEALRSARRADRLGQMRAPPARTRARQGGEED